MMWIEDQYGNLVNLETSTVIRLMDNYYAVAFGYTSKYVITIHTPGLLEHVLFESDDKKIIELKMEDLKNIVTGEINITRYGYVK